MIGHLPVAEMMANLQPLWKPGSMPRMDLPRTGGVNSSCLRLAANTATDAFSAVLVSSDLANNTNIHLSVSSGQWSIPVVSGQWQWSVGQWQWSVVNDSGQWSTTVVSGQWQWSVVNDSGQWSMTVVSGQWQWSVVNDSGHWSMTVVSGQWQWSVCQWQWSKHQHRLPRLYVWDNYKIQ